MDVVFKDKSGKRTKLELPFRGFVSTELTCGISVNSVALTHLNFSLDRLPHRAAIVSRSPKPEQRAAASLVCNLLGIKRTPDGDGGSVG